MEVVMPDDLVIPEGWTQTTLGAIGQYLNGRAFKTAEWSKTGRPIIRIQDLTGSNRNPHYFEGTVEDRYVIQPGDFLISWSATLGAYIWDGPEAVLNQHIFKVRSKINKKFHYHLVRERVTELERNAHGSGMVHVTKGIFDDTPVAIPKDEHLQQQIADLIDAAELSRTSAAGHVAAGRRSIERFRQAVLAAACSGRLTADWREQNPDVTGVEHALAELAPRKRRGVSKEQAVELDLPALPASDIVGSVGEVSLILEYGTSKRASASPEDGVPVMRMGNIQDGSLDLSDLKYIAVDREIEGLLLEDGDLLFNRTNSPELVGKSAIYHGDAPTTFASYLIRVRFHPDIADPEFVNYWINSVWGRAWAHLAKTDGVSQSNINGSKLALMPLPLPPIAEQRLIVQRAGHLLEVADRLLDQIDASAKRVERSSQAVLAKAFRGELSEPTLLSASRSN